MASSDIASTDDKLNYIFVKNLHLMFGEEYLLNMGNTLFHTMSPEYKIVMSNRMNEYKEKKEVMIEFLSNLLGELFKKMQKTKMTGGGIKLDDVKNYIRDKVYQIKPKFY